MSGIDFDAFDNGTKDLKKQEDVVDSLILEDDEDDELISEPPKKMKDDISESKPKVHNDEAEVTSTTSANNYDDREKEIVEEMLNHVEFIEANEVVGLVACIEHYDTPYEFYILRIDG